MSKHKRHRGGRRKIPGGFHRPTQHRPPPGASPGSLVEHPEAQKPVITLFSYDADHVEETVISDPSQIKQHLGKRTVTWINVDGVGDADTLRALGDLFRLHPLTLADIVNVHQRPKMEPYEEHIFFVMRMLLPENGSPPEQVSLVLGHNFVLSFQERQGDVFDMVRARIRQGKGRVRHLGPDYLAYLLLDSVVDGYFPVLDEYSDQIEEIEDAVLVKPAVTTVEAIHRVKRGLLSVRRAVWPLREAIAAMLREETRLISHETRIYLRDCYDHSVQIMDMLETYRELASGLMDVYLSSISNRMNEVMKVLTIIATIFIPLTFIAGVYGMNFDPEVSPWNMPELLWYWGYPASLLLMAAVAGGMMVFFWRRGWFGRDLPTRTRDDHPGR